MKKKYSGIIVPAVSPVTADYKLDREGVKNMFSNFRNNGAFPFIMGTTGEAASLPMSLKYEYIKLAGELKQGSDMLYVGIASNCFEESVALAKYSFDNGADAVAANLPSYYKLTDGQIKKYYEHLADACGGPLIIYNIPATTHMHVPLSVIDELSYHDGIVGVKDSEQNDDRLRESLKMWAHRADFSHFIGWAARSADALMGGSDGLVPSSGNLFPSIYNEMVEAFKIGDRDQVYALQRKSDAVGKAYQAGRILGESLWALKVLMSEAGICQPNVMPPLYPQTIQDYEQLKKNYHELVKTEGIDVKIDIWN